MHFSSLVGLLALPVAILLNYIILIPESMRVPTHSQFVLFTSCYSIIG